MSHFFLNHAPENFPAPELSHIGRHAKSVNNSMRKNTDDQHKNTETKQSRLTKECLTMTTLPPCIELKRRKTMTKCEHSLDTVFGKFAELCRKPLRL